jgi:hypothetical protein
VVLFRQADLLEGGWRIVVPGPLLSGTSYTLSQERFDFLRQTFKTTTMVEMKEAEVPAVLHRYLVCLNGPIILEEALLKWPSPKWGYKPDSIAFKVSSLEHCLALLDLERYRRDLLGYLLLFLIGYLRPSIRIILVKYIVQLYVPYICYPIYGQSLEENISLGENLLTWLLVKGDYMFGMLESASLKGGDVRENISKTLAYYRGKLEQSESRMQNKDTKA